MKNRKIMILMIYIACVFAVGLWPLRIAAEQQKCGIKANKDNYHIYVRDFDRDGNPTRRVIYRGWIMRGQTIPIVSLSGRISVNFKADSAKRGSGNNEWRCRNNQTLTLP